MQKKTRIRYAMEQSPLYRLRSRSRLAATIGLSNAELRNLSKRQAFLYSEFSIEKPNGGTRDVENPRKKLKVAQAKIARLLSRIEPAEYLFCPVKGRSYVLNAMQHLGNRDIFCLDIHKFFPSVPSRRVYWFFSEILECENDIAATLTALATYNGHLPTGSPLSPILSHFCYKDMWEKIDNICRQREYKMTVYIDDLTISATHITNQDIWHFKQVIKSFGLEFHKEQRYRNRPALITGCISDNGKLLVPHKQHKKLRIMKGETGIQGDPGEILSADLRLSGLTTQIKQITNATELLCR